MKDTPFKWSKSYQNSFDTLKKCHTTAPIIQPPNWSIPFELMCNASEHVIGTVLGKQKDKMPPVIYYASRTLDHAQEKYSTTEKELCSNSVYLG